ncbi:MAG: ThiF family adenylyltransferase, partial [Hafnia sp.]
MLSDHDFMRYSRQLLLEEIGSQGQENLSAASVLIIGLGGLGAPAALYLAAAGVGKILLADDDRLHISNLQRQILYTTRDLEQYKAETAKQRLQALNPQVEFITLSERLAGDALREAVEQVDLILDCSDNMPTRQAVNSACVSQNK